MHLVKEPLRYTLLPPYGHTNRTGVNTVPAATPPASLAESIVGLNILFPNSVFPPKTILHRILSACSIRGEQIRANAAPIQCTTKPNIEIENSSQIKIL